MKGPTREWWVLADIDGVLNSNCHSDWLKDALVASIHRDSLDAARDAELLAHLLCRRFEASLENH